MSKTELEKSAELLAENLRGWEERTLQRIGQRIKKTGSLTAYDRKTIDNLANLGYSLDDIYKEIAKGGNAELYQQLRNANIDVNKLNQDIQLLNIDGDVKIIQNDLDAVLDFNSKEIKKMYEAEMTEQVARNRDLFLKTGTPFIPYAENAFAQQLVKNWAEITAGEMLNLSRSKVTGFKMNGGKTFMPIDKAYQQAMDKAIVSVRTGTTDFYTAMRDVMTDLGGGVVNYNSGVTRSLDSVVRSNILYGAKQSAQQYQEYIGKQFGADGFEVDYHPHPRPSHEFMGGKMFSYNGRVKINGIVYEDGKEALARLQDYNCLHFKTDVLLGISEPTWDSAELERRKAEDKKLIEYEVNGKTYSKTKYEWSQKQRELERMAREEKRQADFNKSFGNNIKAKEHNQSYRQIRNAYDDLCDKVGLTPTPERMAVYRKRRG